MIRILPTLLVGLLLASSYVALPSQPTSDTATAASDANHPFGLHVTSTVDSDFLTMVQLAQRYQGAFEVPTPPEGLTPVENARYWTDSRDLHGRTLNQWVHHAQAFTTNLPTATEHASAATNHASFAASLLTDIAATERILTQITQLYDALDVPMDTTTTAQLVTATERLDPEMARALAELLHVFVPAYLAQATLAEGIIADFHDGFEVTDVLVDAAARQAMETRAQHIEQAIGTFLGTALPLAHPTTARGAMESTMDDPIFSDPEGLIIIGGTTDDTYGRGGTILDPALSIDLGGNDRYEHSAGGACPDALSIAHRCNRLALAVLVDVAGNDVYHWDDEPYAVQGAGSVGGLGMLFDLGGNDHYDVLFTRTNRGPFFQYIDGGAQAFGQAGYGILVDASGDDIYDVDVKSTSSRSIWAFGQGFGSLGGVGLIVDAHGDDAYRSEGLGIDGANTGFMGSYPQGSGFYGGVGLLVDAGEGEDLYYALLEAKTTDYYAQAFGAFGGVGILYEDGGDDTYWTVENASAPWIRPLLNCAYGTGSIGGVGIFVEVAGDDSYYGNTISPFAASTMNEGFGGIFGAYGLFIDVEGDDDHIMEVEGAAGSFVAGRGHALQHGNIIGNYLDAGGIDLYVGPGSDQAVWAGGADLNLIPGGVL